MGVKIKNPHAVELGRLGGRIGGRSKSPAKLAASLANLKHSTGRPKGAKDRHPRKTRKQATHGTD